MPWDHWADWAHGVHAVATQFHAHDGEVQDADQPDPSDEPAPGLPPALERLAGGAVRVDLLNNNNSQYYGDFVIGNPRQRFTAVFDTGSAITWVPGAQCTNDTCQEHHRFTTGESASFEARDDKDTPAGSIHYGTGEVKYSGGHDTLAFCDSHDNPGCNGEEDHLLEVPKQPFGMSTDQTSYPFRILPFDGILGLAPSGSPGSVLHQLRAAKALPRNVIGVYLSEDTHRSGSMDFGGIEPAHIAKGSPLHWHKIKNHQEWLLGMKDVLVDGKPLHVCDDKPGGVCPAVVDTGSSLITGPAAEIGGLLDKIRTHDDCSNLASMPTVSLQLADRHGKVVTYPLTPQEYTLRTLEEVPNTGDTGYFKEFPLLGKGGKAPDVRSHCEPGIGVMDVPGNKWVIGDTFLRRYYSIFDDDKGLVGFVRSIHPDEAPTSGAEPSVAATATKAASMAAPMAGPMVALGALPRAGCRPVQAALRRPTWTRFL